MSEELEQTPELTDIHREALDEFDTIQSAVFDERKQSLEDRRFASITGAQWEDKWGDQFENKPKPEVNKIMRALLRIYAEYRNNRFTVDFVSKTGDAGDQMADTLDGLYRADEQDSNADEAYDNAFDEGTSGGMGGWRLRADYEDHEDDENEYQRPMIEPIYDADSCVFFNLGAKRQDKSDAKRCFVISSVPIGEYEEEWGDSVATWPKDIEDRYFDWSTPDVVYIAEFYKIEEVKKTVYVYETLDGEEERHTDEDFENDETLKVKLDAIGTKLIREKKVKQNKVHKYIMSGGKVLEDCGYIAGKFIPIIPFYGKRWFIDNVERFMGHVRICKDVQRLKNMLMSRLTEIASLSTIEKPIFTTEQMTGHALEWSEDNIKNYPYLTIEAVTDKDGNEIPMGPLGYTKPPAIPPALAVLLQMVEQDIQDLLGNQQGAEQMMSNIGEKTVEKIQNRLDTYDYIYVSNMSKAIKRSGEVWLSIKKDISIESGRVMKTVGKQGEVGSVELNKPGLGDAGEVVYQNDFSNANFDVAVEVGPSTSSKRSATVREMKELLQVTTDPESIQVISAMIMMNVEGEGVKDVREYYRQKLIKMGVVEPTKEEAADLIESLKNQEPDANEELLKSAAANEAAKAVKAKADTFKTIAETEKVKAETVETMAGIDRDDRAEGIQAVEALKTATTQPGLI